MYRMRALQIDAPNRARVVDIDSPSLLAGEVRVRVAVCGICGTDVHIYHGEYLGSYPIVPGHEFSGEIVEVGEGVTRFAEGDRVAVEPNIACGNCDACLSGRSNFCRNWSAVGVTRQGAMAEYVNVPERNVFSIGDMSFETGAFVEPLSCVLHGVGKVGIHLGDRVAILGAGPIGVLLARTARAAGAASISVVERSPSRRELASGDADVVYADSRTLTDESHDVVIDASGAPALMHDAIRVVGRGGRILLFGVAASGAKLTVEPFKLFEKGITITSSFTSVLNSRQAVSLLASGRIEVASLVSHTLPIDRFADGVALIESASDGVMKVLVQP